MNSHYGGNRIYPGCEFSAFSAVLLVLQCPDPGFAATEYVSGAHANRNLKALIHRSGKFSADELFLAVRILDRVVKNTSFTIPKSCVSKYPLHRANRIYPVSVQGVHGVYGMARPEIGI
jgi:hypothetical protein